MPKIKVKHVHKLKKHNYKTGVSIFFCILPDCHYKVETALVLGKECLCNICSQPFIMNEITIKLTRPHCINCGKTKVVDENGNARYVDKAKLQQQKVLSLVAEKDVTSLRSRLTSLINPSRSQVIDYSDEIVVDEDI